MSNRTSMAIVSAIANLHRSGHSNRQIAKILELNRETVGKYVAQLRATAGQNQPISQTGSVQNQPISQTGLEDDQLSGLSVPALIGSEPVAPLGVNQIDDRG